MTAPDREQPKFSPETEAAIREGCERMAPILLEHWPEYDFTKSALYQMLPPAACAGAAGGGGVASLRPSGFTPRAIRDKLSPASAGLFFCRLAACSVIAGFGG